jgi:hypothetical protein
VSEWQGCMTSITWQPIASTSCRSATKQGTSAKECSAAHTHHEPYFLVQQTVCAGPNEVYPTLAGVLTVHGMCVCYARRRDGLAEAAVPDLLSSS